MKLTTALSLLAISFFVVSCGSSSTDTSTSNQPAPAPATTPVANTGDLGREKPAGPYMVIFMTPSGHVDSGDADFMAHVTMDGKDVEDAKVELALSMPSMKMDGPKIHLKHITGNAYEGVANVMSGDYTAQVEVEGAAGKGSAKFDFPVK